MQIAGFKKQSLIDYPGNISSVVFTQGCNFRCPYCHNPNLVLPNKFGETFNENKIFEYFAKYKNMLDAVCISGGEPTIHKDLPLFIKKINALGLKVKLDSNGTNPQMIKLLIQSKLVDYIAMDIKHILNFDKYNSAVGNTINLAVFSKILESINLIEKSGVNYTFRTTVVKGLHSSSEISALHMRCGKHYAIQNYNPEIILNNNCKFERFTDTEFEQLLLEYLN